MFKLLFILLLNPFFDDGFINVREGTFECAFCKSGDIVEGFYEDDRVWRAGIIEQINAAGHYHTSFFNGADEVFSGDRLRLFEPFELHEDEIEYYDPEEERFIGVVIVDIHDEPTQTTYDVESISDSRVFRHVQVGSLQRLD